MLKATVVKCFKRCSWLLFFTVSSVASADNVTTVDHYEIHHIAYNSSFLTPSVAEAYQIKRAENLAIINVSVNDTETGAAGISAKVSGTATNLFRQVKHLKFRKVEVDNAVYYLSDYRIGDRDALTFELDVEIPGVALPQHIKWQQTLWKN